MEADPRDLANIYLPCDFDEDSASFEIRSIVSDSLRSANIFNDINSDKIWKMREFVVGRMVDAISRHLKLVTTTAPSNTAFSWNPPTPSSALINSGSKKMANVFSFELLCATSMAMSASAIAGMTGVNRNTAIQQMCQSLIIILSTIVEQRFVNFVNGLSF